MHFCESALDNRMFEEVRLTQAVPSGRRLGRQLRVLVYDDSQEPPLLVGAIGLASPIYRLSCRDRFLGWHESGARLFGLRRAMDLAVCVSTSAYADMRMSKLLAILSVSAPIAHRYFSRYGEPLLAVITTCASGSHCACFNRIMLRPGGLFRKVGETSGYTTTPFSNATIKAARQLVLGNDNASDVMRRGAAALPVLRTAMRRLSLPEEKLLRMGVRKGVYVAECFPGALEMLRRERRSAATNYLSVGEAVQFWQSRVASSALPSVRTI